MPQQQSKENPSGMEALVSLVEERINQAALEAARAATERVELAIKVSSMNSKLEAYAGLLDGIQKQEEDVASRLAVTKGGALKQLLQHKAKFLAEQRERVLTTALGGAGPRVIRVANTSEQEEPGHAG